MNLPHLQMKAYISHMITYRIAETKDIAELKDIFVRTITSTCGDDYSTREIAVWTSSSKKTGRWHELVTDQHTVIIEVDGETAGFGSVKLIDYIDFMYVLPDYQGQGIAKALLQHLTEWAVEMGAAELYTHASITARGFFKGQGFSVMYRNEVKKDGVTLVNYAMEKNLDDNSASYANKAIDDIV